MTDIMDTKKGSGLINADDIPTTTHELKRVKLNGHTVPMIIDDIKEHVIEYMSCDRDDIDLTIQTRFILHPAFKKVIIYLDMKPNGKLYSYIINVPFENIQTIINLDGFICILDGKGELLTAVQLKKHMIEELVSYDNQRMLIESLWNTLNTININK